MKLVCWSLLLKIELTFSYFLEEDRKAMQNPQYHLRKVNAETRETLKQLSTDYKAPVCFVYFTSLRMNNNILQTSSHISSASSSTAVADRINAAHFTTGAVAASFTSTTMPVSTQQYAAVIDDDTLK
jgi:peptidyl-prolyl cis-trans isomerase-like protein 2